MVSARALRRDDRQLSLFPSVGICRADHCKNRAANGKRGFCFKHYQRFRIHGDPNKGGRRKSALAFLESLVGHRGTDCVDWPFGKSVGGYPIVGLRSGSRVRANRHICRLAHGEPPAPHYQAAHNCGRPSCVNPRHLRWATPKENAADKWIHGTQGRGEKNPSSKLTDEAVREIKRRLSQGETMLSVARVFGVGEATIYGIKAGRNWTHIEEESAHA